MNIAKYIQMDKLDDNVEYIKIEDFLDKFGLKINIKSDPTGIFNYTVTLDGDYNIGTSSNPHSWYTSDNPRGLAKTKRGGLIDLFRSINNKILYYKRLDSFEKDDLYEVHRYKFTNLYLLLFSRINKY